MKTKIKKEYQDSELTEKRNLKEPQFSLEEGFKITIYRPSAITDQDTIQDTDQDTIQDVRRVYKNIENLAHRLIFILEREMSRNEIMEILELKNRPHFMEKYLEPALGSELIEMTLPDKPTSRYQKYRLTEKGLAVRKKLHDEKK